MQVYRMSRTDVGPCSTRPGASAGSVASGAAAQVPNVHRWRIKITCGEERARLERLRCA